MAAKTQPVRQRYTELNDQYRLGKTIGCGGFAKVKLATHLATGEEVAIKIMNKKALKGDLPRIQQEIEALQVLSHPNICRLYQVLESETHFFLVMEYCAGGELFDHIVEKERLDEDESRIFFRQIVNAVVYCHRQGFTHRDLKPENILLDHDQNLKVVDFGLCVRPKDGAFLYTSCGSPNYVAPEVIKGEKYVGPQVDVWSLGVLLYALLCGNLPFEDVSLEKLYKKIVRGWYHDPEWLSVESRKLISLLLNIDPKRRITTEALCKHPWVVKGSGNIVCESESGKENLIKDAECLEALAQYRRKSASQMWTNLQQFHYDYNMATYLILLQRKRRRLPLRLLKRPIFSMVKEASIESNDFDKGLMGETFTSEKPLTGETFTLDQPSLGKHATPMTTGKRSSLHGKRQRIRSPGLDDRDPVPAKRANLAYKSPQVIAEASPSIGSESGWRRTPRRMLQRGLRLILTPRQTRENPPEPAILAATQLCNVTGTRSTCPDSVLSSLQTALRERGIECTQKGYTLRGKLKRTGVNDDKSCKLSFELEVCWIPRQSTTRRSKGADLDGAVVGIRRKRLKGDAWIYKSVCEEVLAVAAAC